MIFFDNASTTPICEQAVQKLVEYSSTHFYNPSALYSASVDIAVEISNARKIILNALGANNTDKFIFTSGATEANNTIINSCARNKNSKMLFSMGEHPSVYNVALELKNKGYNVQFIPLNKQGIIDEEILLKSCDKDTSFVSFMHISNETGAITDVAKLVKKIKAKSNALIHCDGVQAFMKIPVNVSLLGVDFYTISAHKFHGPKGIGGFYVKKGVSIKPLLIGGGQESNLRSGTENVPAIMAMAETIKINYSNIARNFNYVTALNDRLINTINCGHVINFDSKTPYIVSISFEGVRAETLLYMLQDKGIFVGNGSACSSKHKDNRVLSSIGISDNLIEGTIRISFTEYNTLEEVDTFVIAVNNCVEEYIKRTKGGRNE